MRAAPVRPSEMTTTSIEAIVISRLRRRLVAVSLTTYPPEMAISSASGRGHGWPHPAASRTPSTRSRSGFAGRRREFSWRATTGRNESSSEHSVDAAGLVPYHGASVELDDAAAHRVDDALVVGRH